MAGGGTSVFSRGKLCCRKSDPQPRSGQTSAIFLLGTKPTTAPRRFSRPCTSGHTPVPSHMEMRHLCSYTAASESGPRRCPSGCSPSGPQNEVQEQQHCLSKTFLQQVLFRCLMLLLCSVVPSTHSPGSHRLQTGFICALVGLRHSGLWLL